MNTEREMAIIEAINNFEMGFLRADEMIEMVCELDTKIGGKVLERLNQIKASEEYRRITSRYYLEIETLIMKDDGIQALIGYHKLVNLKG